MVYLWITDNERDLPTVSRGRDNTDLGKVWRGWSSHSTKVVVCVTCRVAIIIEASLNMLLSSGVGLCVHYDEGLQNTDCSAECIVQTAELPHITTLHGYTKACLKNYTRCCHARIHNDSIS